MFIILLRSSKYQVRKTYVSFYTNIFLLIYSPWVAWVSILEMSRIPPNAIDLTHDTRHLCTYFTINGIKEMSRGISLSGGTQVILSFVANFSSFSLAESPPRDLQITAYKYCSALAQCRPTVSCVLRSLLREKWQIASLPEDIH